MSLRELVLGAVMRLGECRAVDVVADISAQIPAAQAATAGRKRRRSEAKYRRERRPRRRHTLESLGRQRLVAESLWRLLQHGKIRRVRRGVYAPPLPKLFDQARTA